MPHIQQLRPGGLEASGFIPFFILHEDIPAAKQIDHNYQHGGGWNPIPKWKLHRPNMSIQYPRDPPLQPHTSISLGNGEMVYIYPSAWVCIVQLDGSYEVARVD
jgi:hypothetical protein